MLLFFFWVGFAVIVAVAANTRGHNGVGWFFLALLISPLLAGLLVLAMPRISGDELVRRRPCPLCAEPIRVEATVCPHCRSSLPTADFALERDYPEEHKGVRYRREKDGSVVMATANGPRRFSKWQDFWRAINDIVAPDASPTGHDNAMDPTLGKPFGNRNRSANPSF